MTQEQDKAERYIERVREHNPSLADIMRDAVNHKTRGELLDEIERLKSELDDARDLLGRCERVFDLLIKPEAIAGNSIMVAFAQCHETRAAIRALSERREG